MTTTKKRNILFISSLVLSGLYLLPQSTDALEKHADPVIQYQTHVQNKGWQKVVSNGKLSGTTGENLRIEALSISPQNFDGNIEYQTHVQNKGWQKVTTKGQVNGTTGKALQVEAIKMRLTGKDSKKWAVQYRTHIKNKGWQGWKNEGEISGTTGQNLQIEGVQIRLVEKEVTPPVEQKPVIQLKDVTVNQGETFDYASPIVKAVDEKGNPLTLDQLTITGQVDTSKVGKHSLTYTYKDVSATIHVTVKEKEVTPPVDQKPVIQLKDVTINQGETFDYASPIVKAVDEKGNPLTLDQLTITGQVDASKLGKHSLTYSYKDVSTTIHVTVKEKEVTPPVDQKPVIQLKNVTINQGETFDYASPIVKAVDEKGNPLTLDQLTVTGQVDTSKEGKVVLYYTYKDVTEQTIVTVKGQENTLDENIIRQEMVRLVNEYRQENGEQPVKSNDLFHQCTDVRAKELEQLYGHKRPNGKGFSTVCTEDFNHPLVGRIGENIGEFMYDKTLTNEQVAQNMIDGWKGSNPHNMNMLNDYHTDFGFGIHRGINEYHTDFGFGIHRGINEYHTEVIFGVQWFYHEKTDGGEWERP